MEVFIIGNNIEQLYDYKKQLNAKKAIKNFWLFCKTLYKDLYKKEYEYLKDYCTVLQALYERRIVSIDVDILINNNIAYKKIVDDRFFIIENKEDMERLQLNTFKVIKKLMINMPPQHKKSITLVNFCAWCLGVNKKNRVITVSYNQTTAEDFSKYTRDTIMQESEDVDIVYSDIFPESVIKYGDASKTRWSLKGNYFNYLGTGIDGSVTSKAGDILIIDDPIKSAEEAFNENTLNKIWQFYTSTFLSRISGDHVSIINHTRWSSLDLCGRLLEKSYNDWFVFKLEAYDKEKDKMLCEQVLSKEAYEERKKLMQPEIFLANYHQECIDSKTRLYPYFKTYDVIPNKYEKVIAVCDVADTGSDYLCLIIALISEGKAYVLDVYYTQSPNEITEKDCAFKLYENNCNIAYFESNAGGRGFSMRVNDILRTKYGSFKTVVKPYHQSKNKNARILANSMYVSEYIYFPSNWDLEFPEFYKDMSKFSKIMKSNKHDDCADACTALAERICTKLGTRVLS